MAAARKQEFQRPPEMVPDFPYALSGGDMIFATRLDERRCFDLGEVNRHIQCAQSSGLDQLVVAIKVAKISSMPFRRKIGYIAIPMQKVERRIVLSQQIIVDDRAPDQILAAQQVEAERKITSIEVAVGFDALDQLELGIIDEVEKIAGAKNPPER